MIPVKPLHLDETITNSCDHILGYFNDWIYQSNIKKVLKDEAYSWNSNGHLLNSLKRSAERPYREDYTPKEFLDRRKGFVTMFNFCPNCGEKINWKEIKKTI